MTVDTAEGYGDCLPIPLVVPRTVLTEADLDRVVADLASVEADSSYLVIDVETVGSLNTMTNSVVWIGLGGDFGVHLIPMGHDNGYLLQPERSVDVPDMSTVRPFKNNPDRLTKPKMRKERLPASFSEPPKQLTPDVVMAAIRPYLFSPRVTLVGHNLRYDLKSLAKYFSGELPTGPYYDTLIAQHLCDENLTVYSLKSLTIDHYLGRGVGVPNSLAKEAKEAFYPNLGKDVMASSFPDIASYLAKDITYTRWHMERTKEIIRGERLDDAWALEMDLFPVLMRMEYCGVHVDLEAARSLKDIVDKSLTDIEVEAWKICGIQFSLTNVNSKRDFLFDRPRDIGGQRLKPISYTATGMASVDKATLKHYAPTNRLSELFLEFSELSKLKSSFIDPFASGDLITGGRVRTSFRQHGTATSRLSSADPNLQQIPVRSELGKAFRKAFSAGSGRKLVCADYDQIELRCIAYVSGDKRMSELFVSGDDIHAEAASAVYGVPLDEVTPEMRSVGKTVNFLIIYGGGAKRLSEQTGVPVPECKAMIDRYYRRFSGLEPFKASVIAASISRADPQRPEWYPPYSLIPPFGRRRRLPDLLASPDDGDGALFRAQRQAVNAVVQGFAASVMKLALIRIDKALSESGTGARLVLTVHDEVLVDAPEEHAEAVFKLVIDGMQGVTVGDGEPILGDVPLVASGGIGDNWVEAK